MKIFHLAAAGLFLATASPPALAAQQRIPGLEPGDRVLLTASAVGSGRVLARVEAVNGVSFAVSTEGRPGRVWIQPADLLKDRLEVSLGRSRRASAWRGMLRGAFVGASVGGIAGPFTGRSSERGAFALAGSYGGVGALVGAGIGAAIGAVLAPERWQSYIFMPGE